MAANTLPPMPRLAPFSMTDVFVYRTVQGSEQNHRLVVLGKSALQLAYYAALQKIYPAGDERLVGGSHEQHFTETFETFLVRWAGRYEWRSKMMSVPPSVNLQDQRETLYIFHAIAGAVVCDYDRSEGKGEGQGTLDKWILELVQAQRIP